MRPGQVIEVRAGEWHRVIRNEYAGLLKVQIEESALRGNYMSRRNSGNIEKLSEEVVRIIDQDYDLTPGQIQDLISFVESEKGLAAKVFNIDESVDAIIKAISADKLLTGKGLKLQRVIESLPASVTSIAKLLLYEAYTEDPEEFTRALFSVQNDSGAVAVPDIFLPIANYRTSSTAGAQIGRGELVVPFLFSDGEIATGGNALYDVDINGNGWHVKESTNTSGIKMGSASGKLITNINTVKTMLSAGIVDISDITEMGIRKFRQLLPIWSEKMQMSELELYDLVNEESVANSIGDAKGILWYWKGMLTFNTSDELSIQGTTQGRIILSAKGREKVLGTS